MAPFRGGPGAAPRDRRYVALCVLVALTLLYTIRSVSSLHQLAVIEGLDVGSQSLFSLAEENIAGGLHLSAAQRAGAGSAEGAARGGDGAGSAGGAAGGGDGAGSAGAAAGAGGAGSTRGAAEQAVSDLVQQAPELPDKDKGEAAASGQGKAGEAAAEGAAAEGGEGGAAKGAEAAEGGGASKGAAAAEGGVASASSLLSVTASNFEDACGPVREHVEYWGEAIAAAVPGVTSAAACCRLCRERSSPSADGLPSCNVWSWCGDAALDDANSTLAATQHGGRCGNQRHHCWLKHLAHPLGASPMRAGPQVPWATGVCVAPGPRHGARHMEEVEAAAAATPNTPLAGGPFEVPSEGPAAVVPHRGGERRYHVLVTAAGPAVHWQCRVAYYWYLKTKRACERAGPCDMGGWTRLLHEGRPDDLVDEIPTWVAKKLPPSIPDDGYVVLHRPWAILQWITSVDIPEKYILMSEPDHIWLRPMPNIMLGERAASFPFFYIETAKKDYFPLTQTFFGRVVADGGLAKRLEAQNGKGGADEGGADGGAERGDVPFSAPYALPALDVSTGSVPIPPHAAETIGLDAAAAAAAAASPSSPLLRPLELSEAERISPIGNAPTLLSKRDFTRMAPVFYNLSIAVHRDPAAVKAWGWVQEMYAFTIALCRSGTCDVDLLPRWMSQPPYDTDLAPYFLLHYTYGMDYDLQGRFTPGKVGEWRFDKRTYHVDPPPRRLDDPPQGLQNDLVRRLLAAINEATEMIPGWDDYAKTRRTNGKYWDGKTFMGDDGWEDYADPSGERRKAREAALAAERAGTAEADAALLDAVAKTTKQLERRSNGDQGAGDVQGGGEDAEGRKDDSGRDANLAAGADEAERADDAEKHKEDDETLKDDVAQT